MSSPTVLVVDDDPGIRESVTEVLSAEGYRVLEAPDGEEALVRLDGLEERCVVLLDLAMPRMNGLELLNELSRSGRSERFPVVVMSANAHPRELEFPQVVALLRKPFELDELLRWVEVCSRLLG
ncbi:MAG TPA: response regulator [Myxococcaceae bacterium]|jgi:CheY-like chemotaxis protein|nr:response regulator [Myxococcaceae bacterium]